ncbi:tyrosine-type recombinase/integrase [Enterococcus gallinarum]|uniref:tyrosine-type recombinase/integrase n=1 Tax=Enterococcus gallinarum TaxID=1353 RepID=UPI001F57D673|nr:site-specific integrase [Enterococcus gallinarum]
MKYKKTKFPNIFSYETKKGTRYRIRRGYFFNGVKKEIDESGFKTLNEVKVRLAEIEKLIDKEEVGYFTKKNLTCDEYYQEYSMRKVKTQVWSADTKRSNDANWKNHLSPTFGNVPLAKLDRNTYELLINEKLKEKARSSVKAYHNTFMNMLNDAVLDGIIERNRLKRVHIGDSIIEPKKQYFSFESYQLWMQAAERNLPAYDFCFVYLAVFGLRRGEILGIKKNAVHAKTGFKTRIEIKDSRTTQRPLGKGTTKTGKSRWITLDSRGTELIEKAINEASEIKKDFSEILHKDDFLYLNPRTGKPYDVGQLNRLFKQINEITGLHAYPHLLRHYFTSQAVVAGVPKEQAAAFLGHTTVYMTEKYTHIEDEISDDVINLIERRLDYNNGKA